MRGNLPAGLLAGLAVAAALAACSGGNSEGQQMDDLERVYYNEAAGRVTERADAIGVLLDQPLEDPYFSPTPCEDPASNPSRSGVYHMHSSYTLPVGEDRLADALRTAHAHFTEQGLEVRDIRWFEDGSGELRAEAPDGISYLLTATSPPVALAFWVDSPCYQAPEDEVEDYQWVPPLPLASPSAGSEPSRDAS